MLRLSARRLSSTSSAWRGSAATKESWSFLPILNVMKDPPPVISIAPSASAFRAVVDMVKCRTGSLMVMDGNEMVGIVTERDVLEKIDLKAGVSRNTKVLEIMTPASTLVTAPPSYTLDKCVKAMRQGKFRHLPITSKGEIKSLISIRDIAQQIYTTLSKAPMEDPPLVSALMAGKGNIGCIELDGPCSVAQAVTLMRSSHAGSVLVKETEGFGLFTERDYLTKVCVYDEFEPQQIKISDVATDHTRIKSVAPTARVTDCLSVMLAGGFRHMPVVENKVPVGVISMRDVMQFFLVDN